MPTFHLKSKINRITILVIGAVFFTAIIIIRLFYLQVVMHSYFKNIAAKEHYGFVEIPARRGEILLQDAQSDEEFFLSTNITLDLLYADPSLVEHAETIAETLSPLIYDKEKAREADDLRISEAAKKIPPELLVPEKKEELDKLLAPKTDEELVANFKADILAKISAKKRPEILLDENLTQEKINEINSFKIAGIEVVNDTLKAYPPLITNTNAAATHLAPILKIPTKQLEKTLIGLNRYVVLARKLDPEISKQIKELFAKDAKDTKSEKDETKTKIYTGIGLQEEYFRYYPETTLAANIIGFVDNDGMGQYGIESSFNTELQGKKGTIQTQKDSIGRQVIVGESVIEPAVDGADIVLTIDRSIQMFTDKALAKGIQAFNADGGQAIVMDPKTGYILAMGSAPSFDPNDYGKVYDKVYVSLTPEEIENLSPTKTPGLFMLYRNRDTYDFYYVFEEKNKEGGTEYYRYANYVGPVAYQNKAVALPYEPGSVFKPIVMSMALDDHDLEPNSTFNDVGPVGVDFNKNKGEYDYFIHNSLDNYYGAGTTMTQVLEKSLNTGMTFVGKTIGPSLMYNYLMKYGFSKRTDIEFSSEATGDIAYYDLWTESELATHSFGQGITVTLIQLANAFSAIANGGTLMQPHIVKEIRYDDGSVTTNDPTEIRRVISEETTSKLTAMLISTVENGLEKGSKISDHYVAGKTGTAQTYKNGVAIKGIGTTIASFCGYGPIDDPKFVICVKYDHPRSSEWAGATAAVTFAEIGDYIFNYHNIPPDKKE